MSVWGRTHFDWSWTNFGYFTMQLCGCEFSGYIAVCLLYETRLLLVWIRCTFCVEIMAAWGRGFMAQCSCTSPPPKQSCRTLVDYEIRFLHTHKASVNEGWGRSLQTMSQRGVRAPGRAGPAGRLTESSGCLSTPLGGSSTFLQWGVFGL